MIFDTHQIKRDEDTGEYELMCFYGHGIDGQHIFIEDSMQDIRKLVKQIKPCDCTECKSNIGTN